MDRFFKTKKSTHPITKLGHAVCIFGKSGIGKTWFFKNEFPNYIEITPEILKNKQDTIDFLIKIKNSDNPVLLDEYECVSELIGIKEIKEPPTYGIFVVISHVKIKFNFDLVMYEFPIKSFDEIKKIYPNALDDEIKKSNGNLRCVEIKTDYKDDFQGSKEFIISITSKNTNINPCNFIGNSIQEPGNISSILHENYINGHWSTMEDLADCANDFSQASVFDGLIYDGNWDLLPYYNLWGCILPSIKINHTLNAKIRPGSTWTKYQNMCMRSKKISTIGESHLKIDVLLLLRDYAESGNIEILREYHIKSTDLDVLNHLNPLRKIKPKVLAQLKKCLQ
jgi:hypothetical protein